MTAGPLFYWGMVDFLVTLRRHVHRAHFPWAYRERVRHRRPLRTRPVHFLWMTVFGNTAIYVDTTIANGELARDVKADLSVALFQFFEYLPWPAVTSTLRGSARQHILRDVQRLRLAGDRHDCVRRRNGNPALQRIFWCSLSGIVAAVLLSTGGLTALQSSTISTGTAVQLLMLILVWSLFVGMRRSRPHTITRIGRSKSLSRVRRALAAAPGDDLEHAGQTGGGEIPASLRASGPGGSGQGMTRRSRPASVNRDAETGALNPHSSGRRPIAISSTACKCRNTNFRPSPRMTQPWQMSATRRAPSFRTGSRGYDIMGMADNQIIQRCSVSVRAIHGLRTVPGVLAAGGPRPKSNRALQEKWCDGFPSGSAWTKRLEHCQDIRKGKGGGLPRLSEDRNMAGICDPRYSSELLTLLEIAAGSEDVHQRGARLSSSLSRFSAACCCSRP